MTRKTLTAAFAVAALALSMSATTASAGGHYYYGSAYGPSHVELGPADASEDFRFHECHWIKKRAIATGNGSDWREYRRCVRNLDY